MLQAIEIKGFRSFSQESFQKIDLCPFTIIVGENDTGKSNLLRAIDFALNSNVTEVEREDFNIRESKSNAGNGKIAFKKAVEIDIKLSFDSSQKLLPKEFRRRKYNTKNDGPFQLECVASGRNKESYKKEYSLNGKKIDEKLIQSLFPKLRCFITPSIRDVGYLSTLKKFLPVEKSSTITHAVKGIVDIVKMKMKHQEALFKKATEAEEVSINPVLDSEAVLKALDFDFSIIQDGFPIRLKNHGQGMISKIIISLILKRGSGFIVGLEEPEIHMHPNMIREIVDQCERLKSKSQIIIVTHSHYLVNFVRANQILLARRDNKYTKIEKIVPSDQKIIAKIEKDIFLNRLKTEILFAKGVIFVEGPYDRKIFLQIDSKLKDKTFLSGISLVEAGNCDFSAHIALCVQAGIPWAIIADSSAYFQENRTRGPLLAVLEQYVSNKEAIQRFENKLKVLSKPSKVQPREINKMLIARKGFVVRLSGDDISSVIVNVLRHKNDDQVYKDLHEKFGGHQNVSDQLIIRQEVEKSILRKTDKMVMASMVLPPKNELEGALRVAFKRLTTFGIKNRK